MLLAENTLRLFGVILLGFTLSFAIHEAWTLETRWLVVGLVAVIAIATSMCLARIFSDVLLIVALFSLPLASFCKWIWLESYNVEDPGTIVYVGVLGVGLIDFLLVGLYMSWFYRVFITREQALPRLNLLDGFILWFIVAHLAGTIGAVEPTIGLAATEFLLKHFLFYFYISRNLEERHLPLLLAAFGVAILIEFSLGSYQSATGKLVGIALDKGAGGSLLDHNVVILGSETYTRATGTSYDPHALGQFMALILPFPLVLYFTPRLRPALRLACAVGSAAALVVVLLSVSRTAWLATAIALPIGITMILAIWREKEIIPSLAAAAMLAGLALPFVILYTADRFQHYTFDVLSVRYDQYMVAWRVFMDHVLFGVGPGNWIWAYPHYDYNWLLDEDPSRNVVHNVMLWLSVEIGLFGLIPYLGIYIIAMARLFSVVMQRRDMAARLALAALIGMIITGLCGLTDPAYREPNVYMMFWLLVSLSVFLPRLRPGAGAALLAKSRSAGGSMLVAGTAAARSAE